MNSGRLYLSLWTSDLCKAFFFFACIVFHVEFRALALGGSQTPFLEDCELEPRVDPDVAFVKMIHFGALSFVQFGVVLPFCVVVFVATCSQPERGGTHFLSSLVLHSLFKNCLRDCSFLPGKALSEHSNVLHLCHLLLFSHHVTIMLHVDVAVFDLDLRQLCFLALCGYFICAMK